MNQERLERIKLLSARFHELQGLRVALAGATIALVFGSYLVITPAPTDPGAMIGMLVSFVLMIPSQWWINRYYVRTFGRQVWKPTAVRTKVAFLVGYFWLGWWLNIRYEAIPAGAPTVWTVALLSLYVAIKDWPWRAYYVGVTAAVAIAFAASAKVGGVLDPNWTLTTVFLALGASMTVVGLLDHLLLVKFVKEARSVGAEVR